MPAPRPLLFGSRGIGKVDGYGVGDADNAEASVRCCGHMRMRARVQCVADCGCCILLHTAEGKRPLGSERWTKVVSGMDNNARPRANKRSLDGGTINPCPAGGEATYLP